MEHIVNILFQACLSIFCFSYIRHILPLKHFLQSYIANDSKPVYVQNHQHQKQSIEQHVHVRLEAQYMLHLKAAAQHSASANKGHLLVSCYMWQNPEQLEY